MESLPDKATPLERLLSAIPTERARLAALARREGLGPEDAIDCVHEGFVTLLQLLAKERAAAPPTSRELAQRLHVIVKNAARNKRRRHHLAKPHADLESLEPADGAAGTDARLAEAEEHLRLHACVARLCVRQRAVVTLRLFEDREGEDVAARLGISRAYVDVLLHRAKLELRSCMLEPCTGRPCAD
ncbi:MAG: sigma-70 family RNA polymerase sigma factor [Polyangiaceae bacterium]